MVGQTPKKFQFNRLAANELEACSQMTYKIFTPKEQRSCQKNQSINGFALEAKNSIPIRFGISIPG